MPGLSPRQKEEIEEMMQVQKEKTDWNFYHERQHVENLFYNRFNYFLMLYGFFIAAIATLENATNCTICSKIMVGLLIFGIIILIGVWATLWRNYHTLCVVLEIIDNLPDYHSSPILSDYMKKYSKTIKSKTLMTIFIPAFCIISLVCYLFYIFHRRNINILDKLDTCGVVILSIIVVIVLIYVLIIIIVWRCRKPINEVIDEAYKQLESTRNIGSCTSNKAKSCTNCKQCVRINIENSECHQNTFVING